MGAVDLAAAAVWWAAPGVPVVPVGGKEVRVEVVGWKEVRVEVVGLVAGVGSRHSSFGPVQTFHLLRCTAGGHQAPRMSDHNSNLLPHRSLTGIGNDRCLGTNGDRRDSGSSPNPSDQYDNS